MILRRKRNEFSSLWAGHNTSDADASIKKVRNGSIHGTALRQRVPPNPTRRRRGCARGGDRSTRSGRRWRRTCGGGRRPRTRTWRRRGLGWRRRWRSSSGRGRAPPSCSADWSRPTASGAGSWRRRAAGSTRSARCSTTGGRSSSPPNPRPRPAPTLPRLRRGKRWLNCACCSQEATFIHSATGCCLQL